MQAAIVTTYVAGVLVRRVKDIHTAGQAHVVHLLGIGEIDTRPSSCLDKSTFGKANAFKGEVARSLQNGFGTASGASILVGHERYGLRDKVLQQRDPVVA
jgi:hypothetical protein